MGCTKDRGAACAERVDHIECDEWDNEVGRLREWLLERQVREVVMESTAQYWRTVWWELEADFELYLAQAQSNRARRGRKHDFRDAERLVRRHVAEELILSFVPGPEQREWRR